MEHGLSQDKLAQLLGFKDRQTVSAIETGLRRVSAEELILAVQKLNEPLEYFTDPFRLVGEGDFSWRQTGVRDSLLKKSQSEAGRWIAAYRSLAPMAGLEKQYLHRHLRLTRNSRYEDAIAAGERFVTEFGLGETPATCLVDTLENKLGILVLMVDFDHGISGAACRLCEFDVVLIARHETEGRRNFNLAHELFHILTWKTMPPAYSEEARGTDGNRVEQLADNFAAAVLMPAATLRRYGNWSNLSEKDLISRLNTVADDFHVTSSALRWRLVALKELTQSVARSLPEDALRNNGWERISHEKPALFSKSFMQVLRLAIEQGLVSTRHVAGLLGVTVEDLEDLFTAHRIEPPIQL